MGFAARLAVQTRSRGGVPCAVCVLLGVLEPDDATALRAALADTDQTTRLSGRGLAEFLTAEGHPIGYSSIEKHRRNGHE